MENKCCQFFKVLLGAFKNGEASILENMANFCCGVMMYQW